MTPVLVLLGGMAANFGCRDSAAPKLTTPLTQMVWEMDEKVLALKEGQINTEVSFGFTNISSAEVVIDHVEPSCGCTVPRLPHKPWHILPHTGGQLRSTMDLSEKFGAFYVNLTVFFADKDVSFKVLKISGEMPEKKNTTAAAP